MFKYIAGVLIAASLIVNVLLVQLLHSRVEKINSVNNDLEYAVQYEELHYEQDVGLLKKENATLNEKLLACEGPQ